MTRHLPGNGRSPPAAAANNGRATPAGRGARPGWGAARFGLGSDRGAGRRPVGRGHCSAAGAPAPSSATPKTFMMSERAPPRPAPAPSAGSRGCCALATPAGGSSAPVPSASLSSSSSSSSPWGRRDVPACSGTVPCRVRQLSAPIYLLFIYL